jgi:NAD(P)-dependent dehydrogenase (short-subunit alcohol dehydrogenase family)
VSAIGAERFLAGRTALVTAASRNLGPVIAERLARAGVTVAINYNRSEGEARELVERLHAADGGAHVAVQGDTASGDGVRRLVAAALDHLGGRVDVLVNNSGPWGADAFLELSEETWDLVMDANVKSAFLASQLAAPAMKEAGWGRIVNIAAGSMYLRNHSVYGVAKNAVAFLTEELAAELGPEITVNAISPGQIEESAPDIAEFDPTFVARTIEATPVGRLVTRSEIAEMVVLFCMPAFDTVTGATIPMDGGWRFYRF